MLSKEQIDRLEESCVDTLEYPESVLYRSQFNERANPRVLQELIAMLRESQKDAERYRFIRDIESKFSAVEIEYYSEEYNGQAKIREYQGTELDFMLDAAMQRDCDGSQHHE